MDLVRRHLAWALPALVVLWVLGSLRPPRRADGADIAGFAALPVLHEGRMKPMDTAARTSLLVLRGKQTVRVQGRMVGAAEWFLDMNARPGVADSYEVFGIDDPGVTGAAGLGATDRRRFTMKELEPGLEEIMAGAGRAEGVPASGRDRFQSGIMALNRRIMVYRGIQNALGPADAADPAGEIAAFGKALVPGIKALHGHHQGGKFDRRALEVLGGFFKRYQYMAEAASVRALPPRDGEPEENWRNAGEGLIEGMRAGGIHPHVAVFSGLLEAWRRGDTAAFNAGIGEYRKWLADHRPAAARIAAVEVLFNRAQPFYAGMVAYLLALLLGFTALLAWPEETRRTAFRLMALAFVLETVGLAVRVILQGRPPVTNLYSSAVFVGWGAAGFALELERRFRNGLGTIVGSLVGFSTLIIAHHLSAQGDSMEMMSAVLDSNFWLTTHVVTITIGYSATFLAGALGISYILERAFGRSLDAAREESLYTMAYGITCFALFFSFVGTVLGGIWADQSWGRFWGWDPKENGALLIVLWTAVMLHARDRYVSVRDFMAMAVFGNVVTSFSWFGVNMLGIGLHSYGFMDRAFFWLAAFMATQLAVIGIAYAFPRRGR